MACLSSLEFFGELELSRRILYWLVSLQEYLNCTSMTKSGKGVGDGRTYVNVLFCIFSCDATLTMNF